MVFLGFPLLFSSLALAQQECVHDDACHTGECKVWEDGRFVCEPETYAVMVWTGKCISKIELTPDSKLEMLLDSDGQPDKKTAKLIGPKVTYSDGACVKIEIRKRNTHY